MLSMVNPTKEKHVFSNRNFYYLDDFAKYQGFINSQDIEFLRDWNIEDVAEWSDGMIDMWLNEMKNYEIEYLLNECYSVLEKTYYISCVSWIEKWNTKGYSEITLLEKISDIFDYGCSACELTDIYEGENYLKFCISHHDGNDVYYLFFNEQEYNKSLFDDIENCILDGLDYDYYKPLENKYNNMIGNIIQEYTIDYLKSCININQKLKAL